MALLPGPVLATDANGNHSAYEFRLGMPPAEGPDVATAPAGSRVIMTGRGTFTAGPDKTASGSGPENTYAIQDATGHTLASGHWHVDSIGGFVDYGPATPQGFPAEFHGGQVTLMVTLEGVGDGLLTVTCVLGNPPTGKDEGFTLILGQRMNFTSSTSGETVFVAL